MKKRVNGPPPPKAHRQMAGKGSVASAQRASKTPRVAAVQPSPKLCADPIKASRKAGTGTPPASPSPRGHAKQTSIRSGSPPQASPSPKPRRP